MPKPVRRRPRKEARPRERAVGTRELTEFAASGPSRPSQRGPVAGAGFGIVNPTGFREG